MTFESTLRIRYGLNPEDVEPTSTPGWWRIKEPCGGIEGGCRAPMHVYMFCGSPARHTVYYAEHGERDERGRWVRPYRVWEATRPTPEGPAGE